MGFPPPNEPGTDADARRPEPVHGADARTPIDKATIAAAREGDREALSAVWRHHAPHITRLLVAQSATESAALTERIWRRVGRLIDRFDGDGEAFRRWVLQIASSTARDTRAAVPVKSRNERFAESRSPIAGDLVNASVTDHLTVIATLPAATAEAVMLRHVHGLSVADIASITDASEGTVRQLLLDGTHSLRTSLGALDADGRSIDGRSESIVTESLRQPGTTGELAGETWGVDAVVAGMANPEPLRVVTTTGSSRTRRAVAMVAAASIVLAGTAVLSTLVRDGDSAASPTPDESSGNTNDATTARSGDGSVTAESDGDVSVARTSVVAPPSVGAGGPSAPLVVDSAAPESVTPAAVETTTLLPVADEDRVPTHRPGGRTTAPSPDDESPTPTQNADPIDEVPTPPTTGPPGRGFDPRDEVLPIPAPPTTGPTTTAPLLPVPPRPVPTTPPATTPPTTRPPVTSPPTTRPPVTAPPTTRPPVTSPPTTDPPPTTRPPVTSPPPTHPPVTTTPDEDPTPTSPPAPRPRPENDDG